VYNRFTKKEGYKDYESKKYIEKQWDEWREQKEGSIVLKKRLRYH
jgi:hypothetical protein